MAASTIDIDHLKARLTRLGLDVREVSILSASPLAKQALGARGSSDRQLCDGRSEQSGPVVNRVENAMADLFERINRVEHAMNSAEGQSSVIQRILQQDIGNIAALKIAKSPRAERVGAKKNKPTAKAVRQSTFAAVPVRSFSAAVRSVEHMRSRPAHTPLSSVLAQYKEAEAAWANEKARLRREAVEVRKRAIRFELECKRQERVLEHQALDIKALKTALKNRDSHLETTSERLRELDHSLHRTQEETALTISQLTAERDDLKGLLTAALQRLEAVNELVHRAEITSAMMEDKMRFLEEERVKALEAAARAGTEVAELAESRRKLHWQSKLLEKMSEVQLKHNKRKSEALRRLLNADACTPGAGRYSDRERMAESEEL